MEGKEGTENPEETKPSQARSQDETGNANDETSSVIRPPSSHIEQPPPAENQDRHPAKKRRWTKDQPMFWVTVAGVVAVFAYTSVAAWQARLISAQLVIMKSQLDEMRSPSAERPYLFIAHDDSAPASDDGETLEPGKTYRILFENYGKIPAVYRGFYPQCIYSPVSPPNFRYPPTKWASSVLVGPAETIGPFDCPLQATSENITSAQGGVGYLFVAGKVEYDDLSNLPHETQFCLIYKPASKRFGLMIDDTTCNYHN